MRTREKKYDYLNRGNESNYLGAIKKKHAQMYKTDTIMKQMGLQWYSIPVRAITIYMEKWMVQYCYQNIRKNYNLMAH